MLNRRINDFCTNCGKPISQKRSQYIKFKNHFCSRKCRSEFLKKKIEILQDYAILHIKDYKYLIDLDDVEKIKELNWNYISKKSPYARSTKGVLLHRFIMNCPDNMVIDHINRDIFDNRKENLRITTPLINANNIEKSVEKTRTRYKCITIDDRWSTKYKVRVTINGKRKNFGEYYSLEEAIKVRDKALELKEEELKKELKRIKNVNNS